MTRDPNRNVYVLQHAIWIPSVETEIQSTHSEGVPMTVSKTLTTLANIPWIKEPDLGVTPEEKARRAFVVKGVDLREPAKAEPLHRSPMDFIKP